MLVIYATGILPVAFFMPEIAYLYKNNCINEKKMHKLKFALFFRKSAKKAVFRKKHAIFFYPQKLVTFVTNLSNSKSINKLECNKIPPFLLQLVTPCYTLLHLCYTFCYTCYSRNYLIINFNF